MADFITNSITWDGKENYDKLLKPLFIGKSPLNTQGIRIIPNIQSKTKLNYFGSVSKILKAYAKGFSAATGSTFTQRDIDVYQMKAEFSQDANAFYQTVFEQVLAKGVEWNDLSKAGAALEATILEIFFNALESDVYRQFWLSDEDKETLTAAGNYSGTADTDYNSYDGMWKLIFENSAASPSATQIKAIDIDNSAVDQVATVTVTGTSGTCNITFNGTAYLATFDTDLTTTAANWITANAAALLLRGVTATSSVADIIFTSSVPGQPFLDPTISAAVTGDLSGTVAATTANTAPSALSADDTIATLKEMYTNSNATLKAVPKNQKVFLLDGDSYENYVSTLEGWKTSTPLFSSEAGRLQLIQGVEVLTYRGIPVLNLEWEVHLDADFPHASGAYPARNNRIIYTELQNLVLGMDALSEFSKFEFWFNKDEQENRYRIQLKMGAQYVHNQQMTVAYEI